MSLRDVQRAWKTLLCEGEDSPIKPYLAKDMLDTEERLSVYKNAYWVRLVNTLQRDFPLLAVEMKQAVFKEMAVSYLQTHEPSGFSLHHIGEHLPHYLACQLGVEHPLCELASLERMVTLIRLAGNEKTLNVTRIKEILASGESLLLKIHPSVQFFTESHNSLDRWLAFSEQRLRPKTEALDHPRHYVLWRGEQGDVRQWLIDSELQHDLMALASGKSLQEWCGSSPDESLPFDQAINRLVGKVLLWAEKGLLVD